MVSVIIPVYNVKQYLKRCLDSVIAQTYKDIEIILVDDGSNDGSEEICDSYSAIDERISVIHQKNEGQASARNRGLDIAVGEWISFLDSDDWIDPRMYETLVALGAKTGADIASCATIKVIDGKTEYKAFDGKVREFSFNEMIKGLLSQEYVRFEVWNKIWKKTLVSDIRFKTGQISEEVFYDFQAFRAANKLVHINIPYYHYTVNRPGSTNSSFKIARLRVFEEFDLFMDRMLEEENVEAYKMIACMGISFSKNIYEEADRTNQDKAVKDDLYNRFRQYYRIPGAKNYRSFAGRMNWWLFFISPTINRIVNQILRLSPNGNNKNAVVIEK